MQDQEKNTGVTMSKIGDGPFAELWKKVCLTHPDWIKDLFGNKRLKTVQTYKLIEAATRIFGPYGSNWGLKDVETTEAAFSNGTTLLILKGSFFYDYKGAELECSGSFPVHNSIKLAYMAYDKKSEKSYLFVDEDAFKKIETNTIAKSLSRLGFAADVYNGNYDDADYQQTVLNALGAELTEAKIKQNVYRLENINSFKDLNATWLHNPEWHDCKRLKQAYDKRLEFLFPIDKAAFEINQCNSVKELEALWKNNKPWHDVKLIVSEFTKRKKYFEAIVRALGRIKESGTIKGLLNLWNSNAKWHGIEVLYKQYFETLSELQLIDQGEHLQ